MTKKKRLCLVWADKWKSLKEETLHNARSDEDLGLKACELVGLFDSYVKKSEVDFNVRVEEDHKAWKNKMRESKKEALK